MTNASKRLDRLENLRGFFSIYVVFHHYAFTIDAFAPVRKFLYFGQLAVMVFFMLSGFVIYYSTIGSNRKFSVKHYLKRRIRRVYPIFVMALLLGWILKSILDGGPADPKWSELFGNLLMLQDKNPYAWFSPYLHNLSLWTLSYEFFFYLFFIPVVLLAKGRSNVEFGIAAGISAFGFISFWLIPNQISLFMSYFFLWWVGAEFCKEYLAHGTVTFRRQLRSIVVLGIMACAWSFPMVLAYLEKGQIGRNQFPFIQAQHFILVFLLTITAIGWYRYRFVGLDFLTGWAAYFAPISYGIYVFHLPIVYFAKEKQLTGSPWLDLLWVVPLLLGISWLGEKPIQRMVNKYIR